VSTTTQGDLAEAELRVRLAEARKIEAEADEIEVRIRERLLRMELLSFGALLPFVLFSLAVILGALAPAHHAVGGEELGRWLPWLLPKP
jgi:hypothetical protein